jgi:pimeloyl-ACP methyl ester carboxylesterase
VAYRRLPLPDGFVEYVVDGPSDARDLLVLHVGTPSSAAIWNGLIAAAGAAGLRVASYSRPGYGSSPRREGRTVADEATTTAALADRLGHDRFFVLGWSGGGPVALACAALLSERVRACMAMASMAPRVESGPAWRTFWSADQLREWDAVTTADIAALLPEYESAAVMFGRMTVRRLGALAAPLDPRAIALGQDREISPTLVRSQRRAFLGGPAGYLDDNLAQARDWGFRVADIRVPVVVRHGELDRVVPPANGRWLASAIPGARAVYPQDAGHGSIALPWTDVVSELVAAAR